MIEPITIEDIKPYREEMSKSMLTLTDINKIYGFFIEGELAGWAGVKITNTKYIFKTAYVRDEYRGKGVYTNLLRYRMAKYSDKPVETNCTPMSFNVLWRNEFKIVKEYKNGCKKLRYENKL